MFNKIVSFKNGIVDLKQNSPKLFKVASVGLLVAVSYTSLVIYRIPDWWYAVKVQYELEKPTEYKLLTGACIINVGTKTSEDWVPCKRVFGASGIDDVEVGE